MRLKVAELFEEEGLLYSFNSKLVRLKVKHVIFNVNVNDVSFNSKLVRLKGKLQRVRLLVVPAFQFQTGAIKRQGESIRKERCGNSFNSKLVRLKAITWLVKGLNSLLEFQFQTGAIKSISPSPPMIPMRVSIPNWCD